MEEKIPGVLNFVTDDWVIVLIHELKAFKNLSVPQPHGGGTSSKINFPKILGKYQQQRKIFKQELFLTGFYTEKFTIIFPQLSSKCYTQGFNITLYISMHQYTGLMGENVGFSSFYWSYRRQRTVGMQTTPRHVSLYPHPIIPVITLRNRCFSVSEITFLQRLLRLPSVQTVEQ